MGEVVDTSERDTAVYFILTDGKHDLPCVLWQSRYRNMAIDLEDGMEVVLEGNVDFYVEGGKTSLKPWEITAVGEGDQAAACRAALRRFKSGPWLVTFVTQSHYKGNSFRETPTHSSRGCRA